jgi:hypothetical protein
MPQSFVFLRRKVPELMNFEGRALLLDPDIIALADIWELLNHDMQGKALVCRPRVNRAEGFHTAVMLMECNQLKHWRWRQHLEEIFQGERPVRPWFNLLDEDPATIGNLEEEWNDLDRVTEKTRLLHYTNVRTQPWLTGLPYRGHFVSRNSLFTRAINFFHLMGLHQPHAHEDVFLQLLRESIARGEITKDEIEEQIRLGLFSPSLAAAADD